MQPEAISKTPLPCMPNLVRCVCRHLQLALSAAMLRERCPTGRRQAADSSPGHWVILPGDFSTGKLRASKGTGNQIWPERVLHAAKDMLISVLIVSLATAIGLGIAAVIDDRRRMLRVREALSRRLKRYDCKPRPILSFHNSLTLNANSGWNGRYCDHRESCLGRLDCTVASRSCQGIPQAGVLRSHRPAWSFQQAPFISGPRAPLQVGTRIGG